MSSYTVLEKVVALKVFAISKGKTVLVKDIVKKEFPVEIRS